MTLTILQQNCVSQGAAMRRPQDSPILYGLYDSIIFSSRYPFNEKNQLNMSEAGYYGAEIDKYTEHLLDSFLV
jgi:hypothetical protein